MLDVMRLSSTKSNRDNENEHIRNIITPYERTNQFHGHAEEKQKLRASPKANRNIRVHIQADHQCARHHDRAIPYNRGSVNLNCVKVRKTARKAAFTYNIPGKDISVRENSKGPYSNLLDH